MALYIRDPDVDALATELQRAMKSRTKSEAVKTALRHELKRVQETQSLAERIAESLALADAMGPGCSDFDFNAFRHQMWGDA